MAIFWRIIVHDVIDWENNETVDVFCGTNTFYSQPNFGFINEDYEVLLSNHEQVVKFGYFAMTTLSTVGYGDHYPQSSEEKVVMSIVLMIGLTIFSFLVNNMMEILNDYK